MAKFIGTIRHAFLYAGSKSGHDATVLDIGDIGNIVELHVNGGNPFHDPALDPFVGKRVSVEGNLSAPGNGPLRSALFINKVSDITVLGPPPRTRGPSQS